MTNIEVRNKLVALSEDKYKLFSSNLIPGINNILGVRIPTIRKLVKELDINHYEYLDQEEIYFEEVMLKGFIISNLKIEFSDKLILIDTHINKIDNWSLCDSFVSSIKPKEQELKILFNFIKNNINSAETYRVRFCVVALMNYFFNDEYLNSSFKLINNIKHDDYYVKMAIAWAISMFFVRKEEATLYFLNNNNLDNWTHNKALQKIVESNKVSTETKLMIKTMKRQDK